MLSFTNINLHFGSLHLLQDVSFSITENEKIALLGKNGAGKTTLFKILTSELKPDSGQVQIPGNYSIAYLSQHFDFDEDRTPRDICLEVFKSYFEIEDKISELSATLGDTMDEAEMSRVLEEIETLSIKMQAMEEKNPHSEIARVLNGLGFKDEQWDKPVSELSGGWKMRVQIAKLLLIKPKLLLLDEPDNHLDIEALIWFEKYIKSYPGNVMFISHDTEFMSNTANRILELSNRRISDYKMAYKRYVSEKEQRKEKNEQAFVNQQKQIKQKERTITRFMAKSSKTKMAQSMQKQLDKIERIEVETDDVTQMNIIFPETRASGKLVLKAEEISKSYGDNRVIFKQSIELNRGDKVAFVGQNGQGKSTLIKIIAGKLKADSGKVDLGHNVIISYFAQNQSEVLNDKMTALETLEYHADPEFVPKARHTLGAFAFSGEDAEKKVSVLSGGEKARLAMACMVSRKSNLLLLDEPTNHLDIYSKEILKKAIEEYPGTLIIVSHDREILRGTVSKTFEFRDGAIIEHLGDLDYVLSKRDAEDIRSFQVQDKKEESAKTSKASDLSYEDQKVLNKKISKAEKRIDALEKQIKEIQNKLVDLDFYISDEGKQAAVKLSVLESELEQQNQIWDELVSSMND